MLHLLNKLNKKIDKNVLKIFNRDVARDVESLRNTDPYVKMAKRDKYRSPSAYKLLEIQEKLQIFCPGQIVVDLGASPGAWTQVAVQMTNSDRSNTKIPYGRVFAVDKRIIHPIPGATIFDNMNLRNPKSNEEIIMALHNRPANVVLSDLTPAAGKDIKFTEDHILQLCYLSIILAVEITRIGGTLLLNVYDEKEVSSLKRYLLGYYKNIRTFTATARIEGSSEVMILATGYKGLRGSRKK